MGRITNRKYCFVRYELWIIYPDLNSLEVHYIRVLCRLIFFSRVPTCINAILCTYAHDMQVFHSVNSSDQTTYIPGAVFFFSKETFILEYYDLYIIQAGTPTLKYRYNNNHNNNKIIFQYLYIIMQSTVFEETATILLCFSEFISVS